MTTSNTPAPLLQPLSPQVAVTIQGGSWAYHGRARTTARRTGQRTFASDRPVASPSFQTAANSLDNLLLS